MSLKYEYRIRPVRDEYIVEGRYRTTEGWDYVSDWRDVKVCGWFSRSGPYVKSEKEGRRLIQKAKRDHEKWEKERLRKQAIADSRETIYVD